MSDVDTSSPRHLGHATTYATVYDPSVLEFIPRARARALAGIDAAHVVGGYDRWVAHELMWRDAQGRVAVGRLFFEIDSHSTAIVESKSLKLYLFGLAYCVFPSLPALCQQIETDLGRGLCGKLRVWVEPCPESIEGPTAFAQADRTPGARLPPAVPISTEAFEQQRSALCDVNAASSAPCDQTYYTHTFRSLCPVTRQPDFATIQVHLIAIPLRPAVLSAYLATFFAHAAFHEACVESIFAYIHKQIQPTALTVRACFTRRGGIDINPLRTSGASPFGWASAWRQ